VGESVLQIAPSAAAAYSLRSLTGGDPKVVRVRRGSDNHEQDFTASEVSSGALTSFVNAQVTPPLDIQALSATGRDGDFLIAKAAYSLRSLGTRQATLAATGDTVARSNGKFVAQVRRSSDDALKSFTADEVTDGTLLSFVNQIQTVGTAVNGTGSFDNYTVSNLSTTGFSADNSAGGTGSAGFPYVFKDEDVIVVKYTVTNFSSTASLSPQIRGVNAINSVTGKTNSGTAFTANGTYTDTLTATADGTHLMFADGNTGSYTISDFEIVSHSSNGFVKTWYDQSVTNQAGDTATGNHAVQATAGSQPKIVNAGSLLADGLTFDGSDDVLFTTSAISSTNIAIACVSKSANNGTAGIISMLDGINDGHELLYLANKIRLATNNDDLNVTATITNQNLYFANYDGSTQTLSVNGTVSTASSSRTISVTQLSQIGQRRGGNPLDGSIEELIIYASDQTANRTAIEGNLGEAYSIDLPSGVDPGFDQVDGFVETWYDQSGNSKDAIQTTANLQPVIVAAGVFQNGLKFDSDGSSSGPDFRTPISSAELDNDPAGNDGFALVWVGNVNQSQHNPTNDHSVLGNVKNVQTFSTGSIGLSVIPQTGTVKFTSETGGTTREVVADTNALTPGDFGVIFFSYEDAEGGVDPLLSVDGSTTTSGLSAMNSSSSNNIGIMTAITVGNTIQYSRSTDGICKEVLLYTGDQKSKRVALETNIAAEYGITLS
jgi:hypothetical protein